jgi:4-carboxymuconolactone decarboxylase
MSSHPGRLSFEPGALPATMEALRLQPALLEPFLGWAAALALNGVLSHRDHELLALRVASNCDSEFEWVEHSQYAQAAGMTDAEIVQVRRPLDGARWTAAESALLRAADELAIECDISDATWAALAEHYEPPALVEIMFIVGQYTMLSMFANAAGITS